jgi:putative hydrolase of the HAD superfamily
MVDVDGVIVVHPRPDGWSVHLERDLGLSVRALQDAFFKPHFENVIRGRAALRETLRPVVARIAPHLSVDMLVNYWFNHGAHFDADLLDQLGQVRAAGVELHLATVQEHERASRDFNRSEAHEEDGS